MNMSWITLAGRTWALLVVCGLVALGALPGQAPLLVHCGRLVVSPDRTLEPGFLLVQDGKVTQVGSSKPTQLAPGTTHLEVPEATVTPGLVDANSHAGAHAELIEKLVAVTPGARASEAADPFSSELQELHRSGITSYLLAPRNDNLVGGHGCLFKLDEAGTLAREDAMPKLSFGDEALDQNRAPTARMGALDLLRETLAVARTSQPQSPALPSLGAEDLAGLTRALAGDQPVAIAVRRADDIRKVLELGAQFGLKMVLVHADEAEFALDAINAHARGVVLSPLDLSSSARQLALPKLLASHGIPFAFGSETPKKGGPDALRWSAAMAVRNGCSKTTALAAITYTPARLVGAESRIGTLEVGRDADFAIWSGDPLELTSRLLAVRVGGVELHTSKELSR
jgi:imidazolonepropionase-like amidohydrolase